MGCAQLVPAIFNSIKFVRKIILMHVTSVSSKFTMIDDDQPLRASSRTDTRLLVSAVFDTRFVNLELQFPTGVVSQG